MLGYGNPAFVIAEAGVNHNGSVELARELIRQAKKCGADAIKFQTFKAESVVTKTAEKAQYQKLVTEPKESQFHMLKKLELPISAYQELVEVCNHLGIIFLSTPYDFDDVDLLDSMGAPAFKLASMHLVEPPILEYVARKQKPILLSTGMSTLPEIDAAVEIIYKNNNQDLILLQCTTNYPTPLKEANLKVVKLLRDRYKLLVGYSDHTVGILSPCIAIALGAVLIEKHFTLDKQMKGPDHATSATPDEFRLMVNAIREVEVMLGSEDKTPTRSESQNRLGMRRSLVLTRDLECGHTLGARDIAFKRPATGLSPKDYATSLGKKLARNLDQDHILTEEDIVWSE